MLQIVDLTFLVLACGKLVLQKKIPLNYISVWFYPRQSFFYKMIVGQQVRLVGNGFFFGINEVVKIMIRGARVPACPNSKADV